MTDVEGWLADPDDPGSLVSEADVETVRRRIAAGEVGGGMLPKLKACADAVEGGVGFAHIVDGRKPHSLLLELFTDAGIGTKVSGTSMSERTGTAGSLAEELTRARRRRT